MSNILIEAGRMIRQRKGINPRIALGLEERVDAVLCRKHCLSLKDDGLPMQIGVGLSDHLGYQLIRLGKMNDKLTAEGRANKRSRVMIARLEAAVVSTLADVYGEDDR